MIKARGIFRNPFKKGGPDAVEYDDTPVAEVPAEPVNVRFDAVDPSTEPAEVVEAPVVNELGGVPDDTRTPEERLAAVTAQREIEHPTPPRPPEQPDPLELLETT